MDSNREKKLVSCVCDIKGWCPKAYIPQVIEALNKAGESFEGFNPVGEDKIKAEQKKKEEALKKENKGVGSDLFEEAERHKIKNK